MLCKNGFVLITGMGYGATSDYSQQQILPLVCSGWAVILSATDSLILRSLETVKMLEPRKRGLLKEEEEEEERD